MLSSESGLVRILDGKVAPEHEAKVAAHPYQGRLRRLVHEAGEFGADYVYFRLYPGTGAPRPEIFIYNQTRSTAPALNEAVRVLELWNYTRVPLMFVLRRDGVHIHDLLTKPELDEKGIPRLSQTEKLNLAADISNQIEQAKWDKYYAPRFDNGTFWEGNPLQPDAETSIKSLVTAVRQAREEVERRTRDWNDPVLVKRLLIFVIMGRFLEERGVLTEDYFRNIQADATKFHHIVKTPGALARLLGMLEHDLNGDVFRLREGLDGQPSEREKIGALSEAQIAPIADFATGTIMGNQMHLWELYRFNRLPVEAMSYIYEDFLGGEDEAFYTPPILVELLLDEAMDPERVENALKDWAPSTSAPYRLVDPSCGSGVFLVGAWRRLVEGWRVLHRQESPGMEVLSALMQQNIYGVDIKADAIDLTCFSLSVALCAELLRDAPGSGTVLEQLKKHKLPSLKAGQHGSNLYGGRDFFEQLETGLAHAGSFRLVIGNPPFTGKATPAATRVSALPCKWRTEPKPWPDAPEQKIGYHFLRVAPRLLEPRGIACLIQKDAFLYNLGCEDFRKALFLNWRVPQILDFISIRHLFDAKTSRKPKNDADDAGGVNEAGGKVDTKVVAVFIEAAPSSELDVITHVTLRKVRAVEQRLFFEVDAYDVHRVPLSLATSDPKVWKANLLGGGRMLQTYHAVKGSRTIQDFLASKKCIDHRPDTRTKEERKAKPDVDYDGQPIPKRWFCSEGFKGDGGKKHRPLRRSMLCIATDQFPILPVRDPSIKIDGLDKFESPRDIAIYSAPHLLIKEHESLPSVFRGGACSEPMLFRDQIVGIHCPPDEQVELINLSNYLGKWRRDLAFFVAFSPRCLVNKQSAIGKKDIMDLPYPEDSKLHFRGVETDLRDDVLNHMIPLIKYGTGKPETAHLIELATPRQLQSFSKTLIKVLRNTWKEIRECWIEDMGSAWCVAYSLDGTGAPALPEGDSSPVERLSSLLEHRAGPHLRFRRVVREFSGNVLYLTKPKDYRYWLESVAVRDADEITGSVMSDALRASQSLEVPA